MSERENKSRSFLALMISDRGIGPAIFSFAVTRLLILIVVLLAANIRFEPPTHDQFGDIHETTISLNSRSVSEVLGHLTSGADSLWILNIARNGYEKIPFDNNTQHTWAYFPLYPLLLGLVSKITGNLPLTGMGLSSLFFLFALIVLHRTVRAFGFEDQVADRTAFYLAAFPVSYFFSLAQTESLFLLLTVSCFFTAKRGRWWWAGLCGGLASATRFAGIFVLIPMMVLYWQNQRETGRFKVRWDLFSLLLVPLGLGIFMIYLKSITGNAFAFSDVQVAWGHNPGGFWRPLITYLTSPALVSVRWDFRLLNFAAAVAALVTGVILLRWKAWAFALYTFVSILVPLCYQSTLQSIARYVLVIFPVFIVLAVAGRSARVDQVIRVTFIALLTLMSAMLAVRVTLALA